MNDCSPVVTPLPSGLDLLSNEEIITDDDTLCQQLIGALMHFVNTVGLDICFAVH